MKIGICERGWARAGASSAVLIDELCTTAVEIERLGFHKLWLTEHHLADYGWALPDLLIPVIAAATRRLVVGIGGVLVSSRNPYRTALDMSLLHTLLGERFEIGVGRAAASINHRCLSGDDEPVGSKEISARYLERLAALLSCFGLPVARSAFHNPHHDEFRLLPPLTAGHLPIPWILGSSVASMMVAAQWGLPFGCIDVPGAREVVTRYRETFRPSPWLSRPRVLVSVIGVSGDNVADALHERHVNLDGNAQAKDFVFVRSTAGERLATIAETYGPDEIVYTDCSSDPRHRLATYQAIVELYLGRQADSPMSTGVASVPATLAGC